MGTTLAEQSLSGREIQSPLKSEEPNGDLTVTPPVLQCPMEDGIALTWSVNRPAAGFVQFGTQPDKLDRTAYGDVFGLMPYGERYLQLRIEGLEANTKYFYRTVTTPFDYITAYKFKRGEAIFSDVYSFETPGPDRDSVDFAVINDTHNKRETLQRLMERLDKIAAGYTIWNGDMVDSLNDDKIAVEAILHPGGSAFATERPMLFVPGNHECRGAWARQLSLAVPTWKPRDLGDWGLGRNFVVRNGPLAMIGLDTGEDKPDAVKEFGGMAHFGPYREAQRNWLDRVLKSPMVATAPFVVVFCHIPLFDSRPDANGGDLMVGWADFQRQAGDLWGPLLTQHGVQLVVAAHMHRFRYDEPTADRTWAQVVGGGHSPKGQITIIRGKVQDDQMEIVVDELNQNKEIGRWNFSKRKIS